MVKTIRIQYCKTIPCGLWTRFVHRLVAVPTTELPEDKECHISHLSSKHISKTTSSDKPFHASGYAKAFSKSQKCE